MSKTTATPLMTARAGQAMRTAAGWAIQRAHEQDSQADRVSIIAQANVRLLAESMTREEILTAKLEQATDELKEVRLDLDSALEALGDASRSRDRILRNRGDSPV